MRPTFIRVVACVSLAACAPSLSSMQTARIANRGHFAAAGGFDVGVPLQNVDTAINLAKAADDRVLTDAEKLAIIDGGLKLTAMPPSFAPHVSLAYGLTERLELGARYAGQGWRLGGRVQVLRHEDGPFDLVMGFGVSRALTAIPLGDTLPVLKIDEFSRVTFDFPMLIGTSRDWMRVWAGPRLLYTRMGTKMRLEIPAEEIVLASFDGDGFFYGGQAGFALGWKHVFAAFELTLTKFKGSATAAAFPPLSPASRTVDIDTFVIHPSVALLAEF